MLSQPATKIFMKTAEPKAAEWISEAIGKVEIERLKETKFDGTRSGHNFTVERQIEPLVMGSEISGLDDRHAYLKLGNRVARFAFDYMDLPTPTPGFLPRKTAGGLRFNPDTLEQVPSIPAPDESTEKPEETQPATESDGPHDKERAPIAWPTPATAQQTEEQKPTPQEEQEELEAEQALGPALIRET
jgi:type IV secretory pathway TraG/TraD family ATPase VirD4